MKTNKEFPNGFELWIETYHEITKYIALQLIKEDEDGEVLSRYEEQGTGGTYELAEAIDQFLHDKNFSK